MVKSLEFDNALKIAYVLKNYCKCILLFPNAIKKAASLIISILSVCKKNRLNETITALIDKIYLLWCGICVTTILTWNRNIWAEMGKRENF
jgi:hypothetical protein